MTEEVKKKKVPFAERYPNHRVEYRNEKVFEMTPAQGWWKRTVGSDGDTWVQPVAFFAKVSYEERRVWTGGQTLWEVHEIIYANTGTGDFWLHDYRDAITFGSYETLFYDPDYRLTQDEQHAGMEWVAEQRSFMQSKN